MSGRGSVGASQVGLQFSVYPLRQEHLHPTIEAAVPTTRDNSVHDDSSEALLGRSQLSSPGD